MNIEAKRTCDVEVMDVIRHQDGKVADLFLRMPDGFEFAPSDGIGIPASLSQQTLFKLKALLKGRDGQELLVPQNGFPGPDYAAPSDELLDCLLSKVQSAMDDKSDECPFHKAIKHNAIRLKTVLNDKDLKERLKANYSVFDLLSLFPRILSPMDVVEFQPKEHGNKTYTVDGRSFVQKNGVKCFRLNVTQDDGLAYRTLFGEESPEGTKPGQASSYLRGLEIGDMLTINVGIKPGPQIPKFDNGDRAILLVAQGNAMIRMLSILEDIKTRKAAGEVFGPVFLVGAFKTGDDVLELAELIPYLDNATLSELHLCMSREEKAVEYDHVLVSGHSGVRVQDLFHAYPFSKLHNPFVLLAGGQRFFEGSGSVGQFLADRFGYDLDEITFDKKMHDDMRVSHSPDRRHELQGRPYEAIDGGAFPAKASC